ncbi:MAG TPA: nitrilase-related carbon-nitrogen hydrolase [Prosthecobacter sp.]
MERVNRTLVLLAAGVAYSFAFPPYGWWPLALMSVGAVTWLLCRTSCRGGWWLGFIWGMAAFGTGLSWMWNIFGALSIALWGVLALFPALFGWLVALARQRGCEGAKLVLFVAVAWTGTEFLRCEVMPLRFPWLHLGLALEPWPLVSWIGVYGLGLLAMLAVSALVLRAWGLVLVVWMVFLLDQVDVPGPGVEIMRVAAVQAEGVPPRTYQELTDRVPMDVQLIVWPEQSMPTDVRNVKPAALAAMQEDFKARNAVVVFGTQTSLGGARWENTALTVDGTRVLGAHVKNHPVHLFDDGEKGATAQPVSTPLGAIGTPVCFDCDFHDVVRKMTAAGAEFFAVPSMDAVSWSARQHVQHSQLFRVRAAENRRWMVVAASSGVSQIINAQGTATRSLAAMQTGVIDGEVERRSELTFYTRAGWLTPWVALGALLVWSAWPPAFSAKGNQQPEPRLRL